MSLFRSEMQLLAQMFTLLEQANLAPRKKAIDSITVDGLEHEGQVEVEIVSVDTACPNCEGQCESGGPFDCYVCHNTGQAEKPRIELGRAWTADGEQSSVTLTEGDKEYVRECYFEKMKEES